MATNYTMGLTTNQVRIVMILIVSSGMLPRIFLSFYIQANSQYLQPMTWHLIPRDITLDSLEQPTLMKVHLKDSKTDQTKQGIDLYIGSDICPISAALP